MKYIFRYTATTGTNSDEVTALMRSAIAACHLGGLDLVDVSSSHLLADGNWQVTTEVTAPSLSEAVKHLEHLAGFTLTAIAPAPAMAPPSLEVLGSVIDLLHCRAVRNHDDVETHSVARDLRRSVEILASRAI